MSDETEEFFTNLKTTECTIRDKFAKQKPEGEKFELYTTTAEPGIVSIFYNDDRQSFDNWAMELGPRVDTYAGKQKAHIKETIDHQIMTPVLEIIGEHDGSVCMSCPPDPNSEIGLNLPFVTILMRDIHGYSSIEFTVSDSIGVSRKIHAKNFKSRITIGELNCEIPMRLIPTWNYACVNLDETLENAFGTSLVSVQRIKVNANCRVRRVFFSEEMIPFERLPEEYRIKVILTDEEKLETQMFEDFLSNDTDGEEKVAPWTLPKLPHHKPIHRIFSAHETPKPKPNIEIEEEEEPESQPEKYPNLALGVGQVSNSNMLRNMLSKHVPSNMIPKMNLVYHQATNKEEGSEVKKKVVNVKETCAGGEDRDRMVKLKQCFEQFTPIVGHSAKDKRTSEVWLTDWEMMNHEHPKALHRHHRVRGCKYNTIELAKYLKYREALGEYDLFAGTLGNQKFLEVKKEQKESKKAEESPPTINESSGERPSLPPESKSTFGSTPSTPTQDDDDEEEEEEVEWATWTFTGLSWAETREANQKLLEQAKRYYKKENKQVTITGANLALKEEEKEKKKGKKGNKLVDALQFARPMLPKIMKEEMRGTGAHYDIVFDNDTLPIQYY